MNQENHSQTPASSVPQQRIQEKVDELMSRLDYPGVERLLLYWRDEAVQLQDLRGQLMICNELIGHYRKTGEHAKAEARAEEALALLSRLGFAESLSAATTYVNYATALNAFGENVKALHYFELARTIYENSQTDAQLLGGLYNNMGLTLAALNRYEDAYTLYDLAMQHIAGTENGALEQAVTCLNRANAVEDHLGMEKGEKQIFALLDQAADLITDPELPRNGYYAYVCEKCAPTFEYYGYFLVADTLKKSAEAIYERP